MKKIINSVDSIVDQMCKGIVDAHSSLALDERYRIISRKEYDKGNVCVISGGGSGHEPAHAGYVGKGMLTAAVCGDVFASPSTMQVYHALLRAGSEKGVLLVIKNYSGDVMNFEAAVEMAEEEDIRVECVYVNDDIAVRDSTFTVGRRGVAGTIFVHKIAGAAAEAGAALPEVKRVAEKVVENVKSIGFALTSCTVPAKGSPTFSLGETEMEFGVGIHGEPGVERREMESAAALAERMCAMLLRETVLSAGGECALLVNGMGGTPLMELYVLSSAVTAILQEKGIAIHRAMVGNYMTSLDMAGASVTLLRLDGELKQLLDAPADTPAWR